MSDRAKNSALRGILLGARSSDTGRKERNEMSTSESNPGHESDEGGEKTGDINHMMKGMDPSLHSSGVSHLVDKVVGHRKIGHRRVGGDGTVSYKKVQISVGAMTRYDERDLLMQDFLTVETYYFPKSGSPNTPAHSCSDFTFKAFAPLAFQTLP
ncbi:Putative LOC100748690 [Caligus rogercresseyi]|uniref:LOC100748690 n=1 Tax=Caligus rogercresseyi TaxID=217165 RepID=A0A7T8QS70_CALRO|nr:Putative LOC100748690 [Caligus rogercresseyi]